MRWRPLQQLLLLWMALLMVVPLTAKQTWDDPHSPSRCLLQFLSQVLWEAWMLS
jgi:hypothetical protein